MIIECGRCPLEINSSGISKCIKDSKRLIGFDNFEGHKKEENSHHKHIKENIIPYTFVDEWKLIGDFNEEVEKIKKGILK